MGPGLIIGLIQVASVILPLIYPAKGPKVKGGPQIDDQIITTSTYGTGINISYGTNRLAGNLFWTGGIIEVEERYGGGLFGSSIGAGKGGGTGSAQIQYSYYASFAVALAEGEIGNVIKILFDSKTVKDNTGKKAWRKANHDIELFEGGEDQEQASLIVADKGVDTPAFRGVAYLIMDLLPLYHYGNRIPNVNCILAATSLPLYPYTQFDRTDKSDGRTLNAPEEYLVDPERGFVYQLWNNGGYPTRVVKYDYVSELTVWDNDLTTLDGVHEFQLTAASGRAMALGEDGDIIAIGESDGNTLPGENSGDIVVVKINSYSGRVHEWVIHSGGTSAVGLHVTKWPKQSSGILGYLFGEGAPAPPPVEAYTFMSSVSNNIVSGRVGGRNTVYSMSMWPTEQNFPRGGTVGSIHGKTMDTAALGKLWYTVWNGPDTPPAMLGLISFQGTIVNDLNISGGYNRQNEDIVWLPQQRVDVGGVDVDVPTDWKNGNKESGSGSLKAEFKPNDNHSPILAYVGDDETLVIGLPSSDVDSDEGITDWRIGKFDTGRTRMLEIRDHTDYEDHVPNWLHGTALQKILFALESLGLGNPSDETRFEKDVMVSSSMVLQNVENTWASYTPLRTTQRGLSALDGWYSLAENDIPWLVPPDTAQLLRWFDPVTLQLKEGEAGLYVNLDNWPGEPTTDITRMVQLQARNSIFADLLLGDAPLDPAEVFLNRFAGDAAPLDYVVLDMCRRAGFQDHQIDVSQLVGFYVRGYALSNRAAVLDNMSVLFLAFDFTHTESDWKIVFVRRGNASIATIPERDMGVGRKGKGEDEYIEFTMEMEREHSMNLEIRYIDADRDYQSNMSSYKRTVDPVKSMYIGNQDDLDLPLVLTPLEAATIAKRALGRLWSERLKSKGSLPSKYLGIDPTDTVTLNTNNQLYPTRVLTSSIGANRMVEFQGTVEDVGLLNLDNTGLTSPLEEVAIENPVQTEIVAMDIPLLRDPDQPNANRYVLYCGFIHPRPADFNGASAFIGGAASRQKAWFTHSEDLEWGVSASTLGYAGLLGPGGSDQIYDTVNTVEIQMVKGALTSWDGTEEEFLHGNPDGNGTKGLLGGEVIQAKDITLNGNGTYTLSNLLRGRRGTEYATTSHKPSERFVVLTEGQPFTITEHRGGEARNGVVKSVRVVPDGLTYDEMPTRDLLFIGNSLRPLSPVQIEGFRSETTPADDITIRWIRRDRMRYMYGWEDEQAGTPLSENTEKYEVALLEQGTFDVTSPETWIESKVRTRRRDFSVTRDFKFTDNGDGTVTISVNSGVELNFNRYDIGSWVETRGFDQDDMNTFAVVLDTDGFQDITLSIPGLPGTDNSNPDAELLQLPTNCTFSAAEITDAGYSNTDPLDIVVYQMSGVVGRGRPGFNPLGVDS